MRASAAVELLGLPAVSVVNVGFVMLAEAVARQLGMEDPALAVFEEAIINLTDDEIERMVEETLLDHVIAGLTRSDSRAGKAARADEATATPPGPSIVIEGDFDEVQEYFHARLWTDGMPVVPPTASRVDAFLATVDAEPDKVLGIAKPGSCELTVLNVAVNGVMAGCRPEYMPSLLAIARCLLDEHFRLEDAGSTPGWEPLVIFGGPVIEQLELYSGQGLMRVGHRPNTSISRFTRLLMRNVARLRVPPGENDKGSIGLGMQVAIAEDEEFVRSIGWPTYAQDRGFDAGRSVVTVMSVLGVSQPVYTAGHEAVAHLDTLADVIGKHWAYSAWEAALFRELHPLLVMCPAVARALAADGCGKDQVRRHIRDNTLLPAETIIRYARNANGMRIDFRELVDQGILPPEYAESDDPCRLVPAIPWADKIGIVVAGDRNRNQSRGIAQNHWQGPPTSRQI
jgi:hypothetical protein